MLELMIEIRQIFQTVIVYAGSAFTIGSTWFTESGLGVAQELTTIAVGLATFVYTVFRIYEIRRRTNGQKGIQKDKR